MKKKISILIPTYNEVENIIPGYLRCVSVMESKLPHLDFEIAYIDNCSKDGTQKYIEELCERDSRVKAIFNTRNFGYIRSLFYGLLQMTGDAVMLIHADMQNPPENIPEFISRWESGAKIVIGIKPHSKENQILYAIRGIYYKMMRRMSRIEQIEQFSDYELLDKEFIEVLRKIDDPTPYLRGLVMEYGFRIEKVHYTQEKREHGKSHADFSTLYNFAMLGITSYSKTLLRAATFVGAGISALSFIVAILIIFDNLFHWNNLPIGMAAIIIGVCFLSGIQIFFTGILGEYVLSINSRVIKRPLVIEERRINFTKQEDDLEKVEYEEDFDFEKNAI